MDSGSNYGIGCLDLLGLTNFHLKVCEDENYCLLGFCQCRV